GRAVAAAGEVAGEGGPGGLEDEVPRRADTATDDEQARVEHRRQAGQALARPPADVLEQLQGGRVATSRDLGHHLAVQLLGVAAAPVRERPGVRAALPHELPGLT